MRTVQNFNCTVEVRWRGVRSQTVWSTTGKHVRPENVGQRNISHGFGKSACLKMFPFLKCFLSSKSPKLKHVIVNYTISLQARPPPAAAKPHKHACKSASFKWFCGFIICCPCQHSTDQRAPSGHSELPGSVCSARGSYQRIWLPCDKPIQECISHSVTHWTSHWTTSLFCLPTATAAHCAQSAFKAPCTIYMT